MQYDTDFFVRYETNDPVPIADIIASLQGIEIAVREAAAFLPYILPGVDIQRVDVRVREVAQNSPLRELYFIAMFAAFQKGLEDEVPYAIEHLTGVAISEKWDTLVTVTVLTVLFYGVGALRNMLVGAPDGPAQDQLNSLIKEMAHLTSFSEEQIREKLDARYSKRKPWQRLADAIGKAFRPSKRQASAPMLVNGRHLDHLVVRDVPSDYIVDNLDDHSPFRSFDDVTLEIHAQDRDHGGKGWAAVIPTIADRRIPLKLMTGLKASDLWGQNEVRGDVIVLYDRVADGMVPKSIHLQRLTR